MCFINYSIESQYQWILACLIIRDRSVELESLILRKYSQLNFCSPASEKKTMQYSLINMRTAIFCFFLITEDELIVCDAISCLIWTYV